MYEKHPDPRQKLMGSILGRDPSYIQVLLKSVLVLEKSCRQTNQQMDTGENTSSLAEVISLTVILARTS